MATTPIVPVFDDFRRLRVANQPGIDRLSGNRSCKTHP